MLVHQRVLSDVCEFAEGEMILSHLSAARGPNLNYFWILSQVWQPVAQNFQMLHHSLENKPGESKSPFFWGVYDGTICTLW